MKTIAIVGASGFIGSAVTKAVTEQGWQVRAVKTPRLNMPATQQASIQARTSQQKTLAEQLRGARAVVCCAGIPDASSTDAAALFGANTALPGLVAAAAVDADVQRLVHISSAVVQGTRPVLDDTLDYQAHSLYAESKIGGERAVLAFTDHLETVVYRPPSVHAASRRITRAIYRLANSPLSTVVGPRSSPTPQAHIGNVASAVSFLTTTDSTPSSIVIHPSEHWTTYSFLQTFARRRDPLVIPSVLRPVIHAGLSQAGRSRRLSPNVRRVQMLWLGQRQAESWLDKHDWNPPFTREHWQPMVDDIAKLG